MNELQIFNNSEFGEIRVLEIGSEPWFVGKDVAEILGYERADNAIRNHVDSEDKLTHQISASGQNRNMYVINESGLYSLILSSKLPQAKKFKRWVTHEILPAIRREGIYMTDKKAHDLITNKESFADLLELASKQLREKDIIIQELQPKALFADSVTNSHTSILVGELAKILKQNGIDMGANRLFKWLRENKYLISRKGTDYNMPTQYSMERGLFEIKEGAYTNPDGSIAITKTPKVTGKGQVYFINKFLN